jgi:hypothetical protein
LEGTVFNFPVIGGGMAAVIGGGIFCLVDVTTSSVLSLSELPSDSSLFESLLLLLSFELSAAIGGGILAFVSSAPGRGGGIVGVASVISALPNRAPQISSVGREPSKSQCILLSLQSLFVFTITTMILVGILAKYVDGECYVSF